MYIPKSVKLIKISKIEKKPLKLIKILIQVFKSAEYDGYILDENQVSKLAVHCPFATVVFCSGDNSAKKIISRTKQTASEQICKTP